MAQRRADGDRLRGHRARHGGRRPDAHRGRRSAARLDGARRRVHGRPRADDGRRHDRGRRHGAGRGARARRGVARACPSPPREVRPPDERYERQAGRLSAGRGHPAQPNRHGPGLLRAPRRLPRLLHAGRPPRNEEDVRRTGRPAHPRARLERPLPAPPAHLRPAREPRRRAPRGDRGGVPRGHDRLPRALPRDRGEGPRPCGLARRGARRRRARHARGARAAGRARLRHGRGHVRRRRGTSAADARLDARDRRVVHGGPGRAHAHARARRERLPPARRRHVRQQRQEPHPRGRRGDHPLARGGQLRGRRGDGPRGQARLRLRRGALAHRRRRPGRRDGGEAGRHRLHRDRPDPTGRPSRQAPSILRATASASRSSPRTPACSSSASSARRDRATGRAKPPSFRERAPRRRTARASIRRPRSRASRTPA